MPTQVQFRRGTTAQNAGFTGANGEISIDTSKKTIIVHDGSTPGGFPLAPNTAYDKANNAYDLANAAYVYANTIIGESTNLTPVFTQANGAFDKANSANVLAYDTGIGANNYAGLMANASNVYAETIGVNANTFANTKLANTTGTFNGTLTVNNTIVVNTLKGPYTDDTDASANGSVSLKEFYYDSTGMVRIRLV